MKELHIKRIIFLISFVGTCFSFQSFSQQPVLRDKPVSLAKDSGIIKHIDLLSAIKISGYVDAYYAYYTDSVGIGNYQKFASVSPRSNQFGLNTAQLTAQLDAEKVRGIVTLHAGDISRSIWSKTYANLMEAHAGVRVFKKLWIDVGFFRTHFGTEGFLPKENFTSSVSVNTYYEPYFESGIRLNYNPTAKLAVNLYVLNGYGIYEDNNDKKSLGTVVTYALGDKGNIGYTNYIGDDSPKGDSVSHLRIHQNLFLNYQIKKVKIQLGGDYGLQQNSDITIKNKTASMYSGVFSLKCQAIEKFAVYGRGEVFNDPQGMMSGVITDKAGLFTGYKLWGTTLGVEYKPNDYSYIRLEGRQLQMDKNQEIFHLNGKSTDYRIDIMANIGISF